MKDQEEQVFPIIDLNYINQKYSANVTSDMSVDDPNLKELSEKLSSALIKWGFAYLINHGINDEYIASSFEQSTRFFELDRHTKEKFFRTKDGENWGYVPFNVETFEKERPFDLKECFNFLPTSEKYDDITNVLPDFMQIESRFFNVCHDLTMKLIYLLNMALPVNDAYFLSNQHKYISNAKGNPTISRLLYYPPLKSHEEIQNHQLRCGEHSDYGTLTLLFQDDAGGLQVVNPTGKYVNAVPIAGSIVLNSGDMLEIWSSGKFKSTRHRVIVPDVFNKARQSIAFFCHPDNEITVKCLDGSDKFEPVNPFKYLMKKFEETY